MNSQRLASMLDQAIAFDTEFHKSQPGLAAPPLVCSSIARWSREANRVVGRLLDKEQTKQAFVDLLANEGFTIVGAYIAIDMIVCAVELAKEGHDVLPAIFAAYEAGRVYDIQLAEALHGIGIGMLGKDPRTGKPLADPETKKRGRYNLAIVTDLVLGEKTAKANDRWRKSYALLQDIPIAQWREVTGGLEAEEYPVDDAVNSARGALGQTGHIPNVGVHDWDARNVCKQCGVHLTSAPSPQCINTVPRRNLHDLSTQCYTHFAMMLGGVHGLTPDPIAVAELKYNALKDRTRDVVPFIEAGIIREDGTENQAKLAWLVAVAYGSTNPCPTCCNTTETVGEGRGKARRTWEQKAPGKVPSPKTNGRTLVNCPDCAGTALELARGVPRSDGGGVSKGADQLRESGDELLINYAAFGDDEKIGTTYCKFLETGIPVHLRLRDDELTPEGLAACITRITVSKSLGLTVAHAITLRPNALLENNRASYDGVIQLLPKEGGVRECFVPRDGYVFYSNDYTGLELASWAQICLWMFGQSDLAEAINAGLNVHGDLGARMAGIPYEELMRRIKDGDLLAQMLRAAAKWGNFGFMGGASAYRLVIQVREQGSDTEHPTGPLIRRDRQSGKERRVYKGQRFCIMIGGAPRCGEKMLREWNKEEIAPVCAKCVEAASWVKDEWKKRWREEKKYFAHVKQIANQGWQKHPISNRIRGGVGYCDGANGYFSELAAQGAKDGLRCVVREQYDHTYRPVDLGGQRSLLYNTSRTIVFAHDEQIGEARIDIAPEIAERVGCVMEARMKVYIPDVACPTEPTLMPAWIKAAKCVRDANGRLMVWHPKES